MRCSRQIIPGLATIRRHVELIFEDIATASVTSTRAAGIRSGDLQYCGAV